MTGFRWLFYTLAVAAPVLRFAAAPAQEPEGSAAPNAEAAAPEIHGVLANSQRVLDRLKLALDLTSDQEKKQYETLKEYIEVFLFGVDREKPVRMDVLTGRDQTSYRLYVPVDNFNAFWKQNLNPLGIPVRMFPGVKGQYRLGGRKQDAFDGYMLYDANERDGYAIIIEKPPGEKDPKWPSAKDQQPLPAVQDLLDAGYDAGLHLTNKPEGVDVRHAHYAQNREEVLGKLKRDADETASDFELRRFFAGIQFDETERLYAEAKDLVAGLTVSADPEQAVAKLHIEPLPGTSLAESVALIGQQPSRFAGVPRGEGEKAVATGRINFPLDEFRKRNALALSQKIREHELEEMETAKDTTTEQKEAGKQFINLFVDLINAGVEAGVADGFFEMTREEGGVNTIVGGMKAPDGTAWVPLIELLPKTRRATDLKMNVGEHQGVAIHELTLTKEEHPEFFELLGSGRLLAGTGPDAVWYAAGHKADEALKRSIDQAAQHGQADPTFVSFRGELLQAVRILDRRLGTKGQKKYREMALQAFENGEGRLNVELTRNGDAVDGETTIDRGFLRLFGKALADFSKENLQ